ncbi:MAG: IS3 family transposase [Coriobacteriales bacterium]
MTYVPAWEGWLFLAVVMDACTKRIVGWSMRDDLRSDIVVDALGMAAIKKDCVHHHRFKARGEARSATFDHIEGSYNPHRRHPSLGNLSPAEFEWGLEQRQLQATASWFPGVNGNGATPASDLAPYVDVSKARTVVRVFRTS